LMAAIQPHVTMMNGVINGGGAVDAIADPPATSSPERTVITAARVPGQLVACEAAF